MGHQLMHNVANNTADVSGNVISECVSQITAYGLEVQPDSIYPMYCSNYDEGNRSYTSAPKSESVSTDISTSSSLVTKQPSRTSHLHLYTSEPDTTISPCKWRNNHWLFKFTSHRRRNRGGQGGDGPPLYQCCHTHSSIHTHIFCSLLYRSLSYLCHSPASCKWTSELQQNRQLGYWRASARVSEELSGRG